jgi:hypothetical protein
MNVQIQNTFKSNQQYQFYYGDELISFERVERKGDVRRILIKVHPDCRVVVHAPHEASDDGVMQAVKKRSRWISNKLDGFKLQLADVRPRQYISGESHYYLGRRYMLKVDVQENVKSQVKLLRGRLEVTVKAREPNKVKNLLTTWYKTRAKEIFQRRLTAVMDRAIWVKELPEIRVFTMQTQWGSCSPSGRLTLNPHLVKAHRECIDYVILHELCHLVEHNHSEQFYRLLDKVMPDWQKHKSKLDGMANRYLL